MENNNSGKKSQIFKKFFSTFFITIGIFILAFVIVYTGLNIFGAKNDQANALTEDIEKKSGFKSLFKKEEKRTNFLVLGVDDDGTRTDVMMLGNFNPKNKEISLVSLPRDTKVIMPSDRVDNLKELGRPVPSTGLMKLNEVHSYSGSELGVEYLEKQIEELLGVEIDFYVKIDLDAFEYLVDEIGGVEFDVPQKMYYNDPTQDLYINLNPGVQVLNGKDAEGLVRFRSYPQGDIKRMEVQQAFIKAFVKQALSLDNILNTAPAMIKASLKYVETDFNMTQLPSYLKYLPGFSAENITTYTLPIADRERINGKEYIIIDEQGSRELIEATFYDDDPVDPVPATDKKIQVLNGGDASGLAKQGKELLEDNNFTVENIGDYSGTREDETRIFVNDRSLGHDIQKVFTGSKIIFDPNLDKNYDIIVVIGKNGV